MTSRKQVAPRNPSADGYLALPARQLRLILTQEPLEVLAGWLAICSFILFFIS